MSATDSILTLDNVSKRFGGLAVVENLSFSVRRGACTGLIGPNGAGKTTVFNLITGVYPIDTGRIVLDGVDIARIPSRRRIHHGVARNFQNIRLMPHLSALENVLVGQHCRNSGFFGVLQPVNLLPGNRWRQEARAALEEAGLGAYERATVGSLPYGLQKRIELVRALMAQAAAAAARRAGGGPQSRRDRRTARAHHHDLPRPRHHPAGGRARHAFRRRLVRAGDRAQFRPQDRRRHARAGA